MLSNLILCAATVFLAEAPATHPAAAQFTLHPIEEAIIQATNAQRAAYGLPPLAMDPELVKSARAHTAWMTTYHVLQHTRQPVAENIAMGQRDCPEVMSCWMSSPGHRANILNPGYRRIGAAAYRAPSGTVFWCQQFMP